eukprot:73246-Pelagomonas_calceolata.AAC.1
MNELWLERMGIPLMAMNLGYVVLLKYVLIAFSCRDFMGEYRSTRSICRNALTARIRVSACHLSVPATLPQAKMKDAQ